MRNESEFKVPKVNTVYRGDDSLRHLGPLIWDIVPQEIKLSNSLFQFKRRIKKWTPDDCPCRLCRIYVQGVGYIS